MIARAARQKVTNINIVCTNLKPNDHSLSRRIPPPRISQNPIDQITNAISHLQVSKFRIRRTPTIRASTTKVTTKLRRQRRPVTERSLSETTFRARDTQRTKVQIRKGKTRDRASSTFFKRQFASNAYQFSAIEIKGVASHPRCSS